MNHGAVREATGQYYTSRQIAFQGQLHMATSFTKVIAADNAHLHGGGNVPNRDSMVCTLDA